LGTILVGGKKNFLTYITANNTNPNKEVHVLQFVLLMAPAATGGGKAQPNPLFQLLPLLLILVIMYFLIIRPQTKRQKEQRAMLEKLQTGDKVLTAGGIIGKIVGFSEKDNLLIVEIDKDVKVKMTRNAVAQVLKDIPNP
jgi:preprotein translocase subunit YajC